MTSKPYTAKSISGAQRKVRELQWRFDAISEEHRQFFEERIVLAKLAAKGPAFYNPLDAAAAEILRDKILRTWCKMKPDGSPL